MDQDRVVCATPGCTDSTPATYVVRREMDDTWIGYGRRVVRATYMTVTHESGLMHVDGDAAVAVFTRPAVSATEAGS